MIVGSISVALLAVVLLFIAGFLTLWDFGAFDPFSGVFITGSLILVTCQIVAELVATFRGEEENCIMMMISMVLAIVGTLFFFLGGVFSIEDVLQPDSYYDGDSDSYYDQVLSNLGRRAALFITGSVLYLVHATAYLEDSFM